LGLDGIVADRFAETLASRIDGILLPTCWLPITTLPHPLSLSVSTLTLRGILDETLAGLATAGAQQVLIISGHYAQGHEIELYDAALRAHRTHPQLRVHAATPLELLGDDFLDHAGRYETSQLLKLRPELVNLQILPRELDAKSDAILGEDPRLGSVEEGARLLEEGIQSWLPFIGFSREELEAHYAKAKERYRSYIDTFYQGSWEGAIQAWWAQK
jgi:creatinine amidohydrolase